MSFHIAYLSGAYAAGRGESTTSTASASSSASELESELLSVDEDASRTSSECVCVWVAVCVYMHVGIRVIIARFGEVGDGQVGVGGASCSGAMWGGWSGNERCWCLQGGEGKVAGWEGVQQGDASSGEAEYNA